MDVGCGIKTVHMRCQKLKHEIHGYVSHLFHDGNNMRLFHYPVESRVQKAPELVLLLVYVVVVAVKEANEQQDWNVVSFAFIGLMAISINKREEGSRVLGHLFVI